LPKTCSRTIPNPNGPGTVNLIGLRQDRSATYGGLRLFDFRSSTYHAVKFGIDVSRENFTAQQEFTQLGKPAVFEKVAQPGTQFGAYGEDKWSPSQEVTVDCGVRYDHSTGFVGGDQISPRIGVNVAPDDRFLVGPWPERSGVFVASPCSGHGFKFASVIGEVLADLATQGDTQHAIDLHRISCERKGHTAFLKACMPANL